MGFECRLPLQPSQQPSLLKACNTCDPPHCRTMWRARLPTLMRHWRLSPASGPTSGSGGCRCTTLAGRTLLGCGTWRRELHRSGVGLGLPLRTCS